jgi:hypothetical protein
MSSCLACDKHCDKYRVLSGDATSLEAVAQLLGECKPRLMVTDPPYGISLDREWRDRAGLNGCGPAEPSYMKKRTARVTPRLRFPATPVPIGRKPSRLRATQSRKSWSRSMNGAMPPRDRGNKVADTFRTCGRGEIVPGTFGLERRVAFSLC